VKAIYYAMNSEHPQPRKIRQVADQLESGAVIAYPTDTVYGFGCDLTNRRAIDRIYRLKNMSPKQLLSFVCPDLSEIARYAQVGDAAYRILRRILPGPYTVVLEATREVPKKLLQKRKTVGIRVPDCPITLDLVRAFGRPIISSSVVDGDGEPMEDAVDIRDRYSRQLDAILDGGFIMAEPSTVISLVDDEFEVIREGKGSLEGIF
jgi:tRNA threonylcarbamoyl adenosine modification protein (Sua5/YciO/YrdC/YwlC family)